MRLPWATWAQTQGISYVNSALNTLTPGSNAFQHSALNFRGGHYTNAAVWGVQGGLEIAAAAVTGGASQLGGRAVSSIAKAGHWAVDVPALRIVNPVPSTMARVIHEGVPATTLGRLGASDVFVTAADDIAGMSAAQIAERLTIPQSPTGFRVIEFPTPQSGVASPVFRTDPGFVGGGRTAGGAREFVIPNQPIPPGAVTRSVR